MRYIMTDWRGRQVGITEESIIPLMEMGRRLNEKDDLVIWSLDTNLVRRVVGIVGRDPRIVATFYKA